MTTRLSNHIPGVLKTFGLLPGAIMGLPFDRKVETLLLDRSDVALIVRPMFVAWRHLREQGVFDKAIRVLVRSNSAGRLLMSIAGIRVFSLILKSPILPTRQGRSTSQRPISRWRRRKIERSVPSPKRWPGITRQ
jgi:hypothetical protein